MNRRGRASQVVDLIAFQTDGFRDVMANQLKLWVVNPLQYVLLVTRVKVVETDHVMTCHHQSIDQVGS